jgi:hypothetical protein
LAASPAAETDEHDIPCSRGVLLVDALDYFQAFAGEGVGRQRNEVEHFRGRRESLNGVGHDVLDLLTIEESGELGLQVVESASDLVLGDGVKRLIHGAKLPWWGWYIQ